MDYSKLKEDLENFGKANSKGNFNPNIRDLRKRKMGVIDYATEKEIQENRLNNDLSLINYQLNLFSKRERYGKRDVDELKLDYGQLKQHLKDFDEVDTQKYVRALKKREDRMINSSMRNLKNEYSNKKKELMFEVLDFLEKESPTKDIKKTGLEKSLAVLSIGSVLAGIFFLSPNLTGNVIGNVAKSSGNILGGVLFLLGIVGAFFTIRK